MLFAVGGEHLGDDVDLQWFSIRLKTITYNIIYLIKLATGGHAYCLRVVFLIAIQLNEINALHYRLCTLREDIPFCPDSTLTLTHAKRSQYSYQPPNSKH